MNVEITRQKQKIDTLFSKVSAIADEEIKAHYSKYLCVLVSGFVETSLRSMLEDYANRRAHKNIANFVSDRLGYATNLNQQKIVNLLNSFNSAWGDLFMQLPIEYKEAFDTVIANRNLIVHGTPVTITYVRIKEFYSYIHRGIDSIYKIVNS